MKDVPRDEATAVLAGAVHRAREWPVDRAPARAQLGDLFAALVVAVNDAILIWQDYQYTEADAPRRGSGGELADWLGERRWDDLLQANERIGELLRAIAHLTGTPYADAMRDHVMLEAAARELDAPVDDRGAHAARVAIHYLTQYLTQIKETQGALG